MLTLWLAALFFPASVDGCGRGHSQSPGPQTAPRCPLDPISSVFCSRFHDPAYGEASMNKNGDRRHPCLAPVFTMKESVSFLA